MHADGREGVRQGRRPDEFESGVDAVRDDRPDLRGDVAVVQERVLDTVRGQGVQAVPLPGRGEDGGTEVAGERRGGEAERGRPAADQQRLAFPQVEAGGEEPYAVCSVSGT